MNLRSKYRQIGKIVTLIPGDGIGPEITSATPLSRVYVINGMTSRIRRGFVELTRYSRTMQIYSGINTHGGAA